jgi:hypothetical protein
MILMPRYLRLFFVCVVCDVDGLFDIVVMVVVSPTYVLL